MCFELDADTEIETRDHGVMTVAELERLMRARRARANAPATLRCSGRFHDPDPGADRLRISSTGAVTASASTTP